MKKLSVLVATVIVAMGASFTSCGDSHKSASLKTSIDSASYAIGISTGAGYKENLKTLSGGEANDRAFLVIVCLASVFDIAGFL